LDDGYQVKLHATVQWSIGASRESIDWSIRKAGFARRDLIAIWPFSAEKVIEREFDHFTAGSSINIFLYHMSTTINH
jgi:hypothetical protein